MNRPLRVAMLIQAYYPRLGGAERQLASLAPLLQERNVEIAVFTRRYLPDLAAFEMIQDVPVYRLPVPGPKVLAAASYTFHTLRYMARFKPDIIHAHELLSPASAAVLAKKLYNVPVAAKVLRGGELGDIAKLRKRAFGMRRIESLKRGVDSFIVISREIDTELAALGVPANRRIFIPNGVDLNRFSPASPEVKSALRAELGLARGPIVIFTGRLDPEKRVEHLVGIWPDILKKHPGAQLLILGSGTREDVLKKSAGAGIRFAGDVKDVAPYLRAADVFVLPSATEGLSNALLEAMACGLAPVATQVGGAADLIRNGIEGLLISPDDTQALYSAIDSLLADSSRRGQMGAAAGAVVHQNYSLPMVADKLRNLYDTLAKPREIA